MSRELQTLSLAERNQQFLDAESKVDRAIQIRQPRRVSVWRTMVGRGSYELGQGLQKKAYRFHPGIGPQRGLSTWRPVQISRKATAGDPGYDATQYNPYTVNYGFDSVTYGGLSIEYNTPNISIRDLRFSWEIKQQLTAVYGYLGDFTNDLWENYHREQYLSFVNAGSKLYIIGSGTPNSVTATYDPMAVDSDGDNIVTIADYQAGKIGILNWKWNKWYSRHLQMQSPMAAISMESGRPAFGWVGDLEDFDRMIEEDPQQREDWRMAKPDVMIKGYGQVTEYKGFILMHDLFTPRFTIKQLSGDDVILKRVNPFVESAADLIGIRNDVNPAYLNAEFGMYIVYLKDVFMTEIPPSGPTSPGGGTSFGATPGLNGDWRWLNIQDAKENPLNEIGFWFMRAEAFAKPLENREEGIAVIYRRFVHNTPMDTEIGGSLAEVEQGIAVNVAATGEIDTDLVTIQVTLAGYITAEAGDAIVLTDDDGLTDVGIVADSSNAPTYLLALDTASSAYGKYTAAGASKVTVA